MSDPAPAAQPQSTQRNIQSIVRLEEQALARRSLGERISDVIVRHIGTLGFLLAHLIIFALWIALNLGYIAGFNPFDPFPFNLLALMVSAEAVFLTVFVLISQNRIMRQAEHRAHLELQINLLAEQEATKTLQIIQALAARMGLHEHAHDEQVQELTQETQVEKLAGDIKQNLPKGSQP